MKLIVFFKSLILILRLFQLVDLNELAEKIAILIQPDSQDISNECYNFLSYCDIEFNPIDNNLELHFSQFKEFDQLKLNCINQNNIKISQLRFSPQKKLILNNKLLIKIKSIEININPITLEFYNINGIDLESQSILANINKTTNLAFYYSNFNFFSNGFYLICSKSISVPIFKSINKLSFAFSTKYEKNLCPLIFRNSNINQIYFYGLSDCLVKRNMLSFVRKGFIMEYSFNSNIKSVYFKIFRGKFDLYLVNKRVFEKVEQISLVGSIDEIDENVFVQLIFLKKINFQLENFQYLLTEKKSTWIEYLNYYGNDDTFYFNLLGETINYLDDSDFCFFKNYPPKNSIFTILNLNFIKNNYCLITWLIRKNFDFKNKTWEMEYFIFNTKKILDSSDLNRNCNFIKMLEMCEFKFKYQKNRLIGPLEFEYKTEELNFITIFFIPIFCLLGILTNGINILILNLPNQTDFQNKTKNFIYKLMNIYSAVNLSFYFIYSFHLMGKCVAINGVFCSAINRTLFAQFYEKYFIEILSNILRISSILLNSSISINRLVLLRKKSLLFLPQMELINLK